MIAVIFEVWPAPGRAEEYLDIAATIRPLLETIDGFVSIERFESLSKPGKILSLSFWRDEEAVKQWRRLDQHRTAQVQGRTQLFADYRLRIAAVFRDYGKSERAEVPKDSKAYHQTSQSGCPAGRPSSQNRGGRKRQIPCDQPSTGKYCVATLDAYLAEHFQTTDQLAATCRISPSELLDLVRHRLVPAASYVVSGSSMVTSPVFGRMEAAESTDGHYFHPANAEWVDRARKILDIASPSQAYDRLKARFSSNLRKALAQLDATTWRLGDSFADDGKPITTGLLARTELSWNHLLAGTFGVCVANPSSEAMIAEKEVLQEKLNALSEQGSKTLFTPAEARELLESTDAYSRSSMPFSPLDYPISSRKRLVDDLRARIEAVR